jgi:transcriptional regulator with XRE-family HTH domain
MSKQATHTTSEKVQVERFIRCLNQAMTAGRLSQRQLCDRMGITIGSMTKYLRGSVAPLKVATGIQAELARELGVSLDALIAYYEHGEYTTAVSVVDVESWIRSESGQEELPRLMAAFKDAGQRWLAECPPLAGALPPAEEPQPYTWPIEELREAGISDRFRERLGLTDDALRQLAETGEFDEDLVEAFSVACNYEQDAVRDAFERRVPIEA